MPLYYFAAIGDRLVHLNANMVDSVRRSGVHVIEMIPKEVADDLADAAARRHTDKVGMVDALNRYHEVTRPLDELPSADRSAQDIA